LNDGAVATIKRPCITIPNLTNFYLVPYCLCLSEHNGLSPNINHKDSTAIRYAIMLHRILHKQTTQADGESLRLMQFSRYQISHHRVVNYKTKHNPREILTLTTVKHHYLYWNRTFTRCWPTFLPI